MPGAARAQEDTAGGGTISQGSDDVIVNNKPAARKNDPIDPHPLLPPHDCGPLITEGSTTVIVNNQPFARLGDVVSCGHSIEVGSEDVIVGDSSGGAAPANGANGPPPSAAFSKSTPSAERTFNPATQQGNNQRTDSYVAKPDAYRTDSTGQVKNNYPGTPDDDGAAAAVAPSGAAAADIIPFLKQVLQEAQNGSWRESGQNGNKSNPNIIAIWKDLGFPQTGCWLSDQTAWCMGFVNFVLKQTGYRWVKTASAVDIQQTSKYGSTQVTVANAQPGDVVLWSYHHVNFVFTAGGGKLTFVGGNQSPKNKGNNPNDGDVTNSFPGGWTPAQGNIVGIFRPTKS